MIDKDWNTAGNSNTVDMDIQFYGLSIVGKENMTPECVPLGWTVDVANAVFLFERDFFAL